MTTRRQILSTALTLPVVFVATPSFAAEPPVYSADGRVAINGYDPVAYFTQNEAVPGKVDLASSWNGSVWQFSSAETKAMFDADPESFAPQYGGYCAWAMSKGYVASTDPDAWTVFDGKLYLNFSKTVRARWAIGRRGNIAAGDANWPKVLG